MLVPSAPPKKPGRTASRRLAARLVAIAGVMATPVFASAEEGAAGPVDLLGSWYVLVHYRDASAADPDADRWEDRIWQFEMRGRRLHWTEYPLVVFDDQSGRFENLGTDRAARVLHAWQPNEAQQAEIDEGLAINPRGSKSKSLRGSPRRGYQSTGALRAESTSVIGYHETWSIEAPTTKPVFRRTDTMGGAGRTDQIEGVTLYTTEAVLEGGIRMVGRYERDGVREGRFQMMRTGGVERVGTTIPQGQRAVEHLLGVPPPGGDGSDGAKPGDDRPER